MRKLRENTRVARENMEEMSDDLNVPEIYFEEVRMADNKTIALMPLVALKSSPCSWFKSCGGCTMCGYQLAASLCKKPTDENIINQTKFAIKRCPSNIYPLITFNSAGSLLDPEEISDELRPKLLQMLKDEDYKEFNFECRPEFLLNEERVKQLKEYFDIVSVGIGLESSNDFIRNNCINKGTRISTYLMAAEICKKYGIAHDAYIQLGKPFLTTREDIEDAVSTVNFAFENGFGRVFLMLCNIQPTAITHFLWEREKFDVPMLWSAIEVIKRLPEKYRADVSVRQFSRAVPTPLIFPSNCDKCTAGVADKLMQWNMTGDFGHIQDMPNCECLGEFQDRLKEKRDTELKEHVDKVKRYIFEELENGK